ncbi:MAG TPA: hypothetical protein VGU22_03050, partial [Methylomirabilota bacterium]|nr:hypothetical protein [Methylomirabilota bacterium]
KREAETSVVLLNNQTLVLGGLIQDKTTLTDQGIPWLKNVPIFGFLFGFKEKATERTELLLLITPRVIGTALDAARITDQMRRSSPELDETVKNAPRPPSVLPPGPPPVPLPSPAPSSAPVSSAPSPASEPVTPPAVTPAPVTPAPEPPSDASGVPVIPPAPPPPFPPPRLRPLR